MIRTNAKKIAIISVIILVVNLFFNVRTTNATTIKTSNTVYNNNTSVENFETNISNEEELSTTIKDLILTINSEGMTKSVLSYTINLYVVVTEKYSNKEIASIIEDNKLELEENGVSSDDLNSITRVLRSVDTNQLKKVLEQINIDDISTKIESGENLQTILQDIAEEMSTTEKVNLVVNILLSAYFIKIALIVLVVVFIYRTLLRCVIYKKAGKKAWAPFIPIYRNVVMLKICGMSPWWLLLIFLPILGWILLWVISVSSKFMLAESFGKGTGFAFGLWLLAPIFETILVFSKKTKYIGFEE